MYKRKKFNTFHPIILILLTLTILFSFGSIVKGYYGDGDCSQAHGITNIDVPLDNDASITLDGKKSESFWTDLSNQKGVVSIKLSEMREDNESIPKIYTLNATFIMNQDYIYIFCEWLDSTPEPVNPLKDEICFCWNINTPNFSAFYQSTMNTIGMGGGKIDSWRWRYPSDSITDMSCDENGWESGEIENVQGKYNYSETEEKYSLELRRNRNTNDEEDVQFNEKKLYLFNVAIFNDSSHDQHAISWTYSLDLTEPTNSVFGFIIFPIILMIGIISIIRIFKLKTKIQ